MLKSSCVLALFLILLLNLSCEKDTSPFSSETKPEWLVNYISQLESNNDNTGTKIYRYSYDGTLVYHISIPISSCAYCEIYNQKGNKLDFSNHNKFLDFFNNRKNETLIWEWPLEK